MRIVQTTSRQSNRDVKQAIIPFPRPAPRQLERGQFHAYKLHTTPQTRLLPLTSSPYLSLTTGPQRNGSSFDVALPQYSK
eukprot:10149280-Ditylum_brightwellii.AAC.1